MAKITEELSLGIKLHRAEIQITSLKRKNRVLLATLFGFCGLLWITAVVRLFLRWRHS